MESIQSKSFKLLLRLVGRKQFWEQTGEELRKGIEKRRRLNHEPPKKITKVVTIEKFEEKGHFYYEMTPKERTSKKHIFYLHGGGYIHKITKYHWGFLGRLVQELHCSITVPLYPLAPEYTYKDTFEFVVPLYKKLAEHDPTRLIVMGDSAGGGLALALSQFMKENDVP